MILEKFKWPKVKQFKIQPMQEFDRKKMDVLTKWEQALLYICLGNIFTVNLKAKIL